MVYHTLREVPPEQYRPISSIHGEKPDHLPGRGIGPLSIIDRVGEDHWQMESSCDVGARIISGWPSIEKGRAVGLASHLDVSYDRTR